MLGIWRSYLLIQVAGLAKRAHDTPCIQHKFEEYVSTIPNLSQSQRQALVRRVVTRWNTDLDSLWRHVYFRPAVNLLTADRDLSLKQYQLTEPQWILAEQLISELKVCSLLLHSVVCFAEGIC